MTEILLLKTQKKLIDTLKNIFLLLISEIKGKTHQKNLVILKLSILIV